MEQHFHAFPDNYPQMREQGLAYFRYFVTDKGLAARGQADQPRTLEALAGAGHVAVEPLVYEDFLPVSAAGSSSQTWGMGRRVTTRATPTGQPSSRRWGAARLMSCSCMSRRSSVPWIYVLKRC